MLETAHIYRFANVVVDCARFSVVRDGRTVKITPRAFEVLVYLLRHRDRVIGKQELFEQVWRESFVSDNALTRMIKEIRHVIDDDANAPRHIETVPRRGYRFIGAVREATEGLATPAAQGRNEEDAAGRLSTIAILPFQVLGAEPANDYLQLGLADTLITRLSNVGQLIVRSTSSVLRFVDGARDAVRAGRDLGVDCVLDGHVQKLEDRIRVTVQLVRVQDGAPLWAAQFDERVTDIFAVQDLIAERVTNALTLKLSTLERERLATRATSDAAAYQAYLKGRFFWNRRTVNEIKRAAEHFEQAIELDPGFALAWAGLADAYALYSTYGVAPPKEAYPRAESAARTALKLDEHLAEAHTTLGLIHYEYDWDWTAAERAFERALELKPNYATAHHWYAGLLVSQGRFAEGLDAIRRAQELDPLSLIINAWAGWFHYYARRYDRALEEVTKALEMDPHFGVGYLLLALVHLGMGWTAPAVDAARTALRLLEESGLSLQALIYVLHAAGQHDEARELQERVERLAEKQYVSSYERALICVGRGDRDAAFARLDAAVEQRDPWLIWLRVEPQFDPLRSDPRFERLVARIVGRG